MEADIRLMQLQIKVLLKLDDLERITGINEPESLSGPSLFLGRTKQGNVLRFNADFPEKVKKQIEEMIKPDSMSVNLANVLSILNNYKPVVNLWLGPAYVFPEDIKTMNHAVQITEENQVLLKHGFPELLSQWEWRQPILAMIKDGMAVSVCCSARKSSAAAEASLETLEAYRGKGYAHEAALAWASAIQKEGKVPFYSTAWDNFASQAVAKKLKLYPFGVDFHCSWTGEIT